MKDKSWFGWSFFLFWWIKIFLTEKDWLFSKSISFKECMHFYQMKLFSWMMGKLLRKRCVFTERIARSDWFTGKILLAKIQRNISRKKFTKNNFAHSNSSRRISLYTFRSWNCYWTNCTKSIEEKPLFHCWTEFRAKITICEIISLKKCELPKKKSPQIPDKRFIESLNRNHPIRWLKKDNIVHSDVST